MKRFDFWKDEISGKIEIDVSCIKRIRTDAPGRISMVENGRILKAI